MPLARAGNAHKLTVIQTLGVTHSTSRSPIVLAGRRIGKAPPANERGRALLATAQGDNWTRSRPDSTRRVRESAS